MTKKTKSIKKQMITDEEKLHKLSHKIFDDTVDKALEFISTMLSDYATKHDENVKQDERFDVILRPTMAAMFSVLVDYCFHVGFPKGEILEMIADFYQNSEENCQDEHSKDPDEQHDENIQNIVPKMDPK